MPEIFGEPSPSTVVPGPASPPSTLAALLGETAEAILPSEQDILSQDKLVNARLGVASGLFTAMRAKHSPTAQHCLRVALRCSAVGSYLGLEGRLIDQLEIAALLHDVGKIGVPDRVLTKAGALDWNEADVMRRHRGIGLRILATCVADDQVLEIVRYAGFRFDGGGQNPPAVVGNELPIGARILAVVDAFDAMTTDHVYRSAFPRDRALAELFKHSTSQFDPEIVRKFADLSTQTEAELAESVSQRWSRYISPEEANSLWQLKRSLFEQDETSTPALLFQQKLLDTMGDGVVFIDARNRIVLWNRGIERLTGRSRESVMEKEWNNSILGFRDLDGNLIRESTCPVSQVVNTGVQTLRRLTLTNVNRAQVAVNVHVIPVVGQNHRRYGITMLLHDVSSEINLEKRVENLHEKATTDPLTQVSNRAEFDRVHEQLVEQSLETGTSFCIIICDIDHFKTVNDVYGHQAGDAALISFADLLARSARENDVVARYGGEEFVLVCADCDNAAASTIAEKIRFELANTSQPMLKGKAITASFGVTEVQMGDTPETMLRRADRALYSAKDAGRNRVVQLGAGLVPDSESSSERGWLSWIHRRPLDCFLDRWLVVNVPLNLLVEKIKGFISDHNADIVEIKDNYIVLAMSEVDGLSRRQNDRPTTIMVELTLDEPEGGENAATQTFVHVIMRPKRARDRRSDGSDQAQHILSSLKSYLMAQECGSARTPSGT